MAQTMIMSGALTCKPFLATPAARPTRSARLAQSVVRRGAGDDNAPKEKGVTWGPAATWPPQPITEHGQPREIDDPKNWKGTAPFQEYVGEGDVDKERAEIRDRNNFSKEQEGGTQIGGGGEGSAS